MAVVFIVLALAGYLGFLIDWKELKDVLSQGGWAALALYCVITALIYAVLVSPAVVATTGMHH
jgi:uncharacterized membrane protein YdjX (TVP38/TMEM64 family)